MHQEVDLLVQKFFADYDYNDVTVYSIYQNPRNFYSTKFKTKFVDVADDVKKERERQQFKDKQMSIDSNYSLIIWDSVSKGNFSFIIRALELGKKVVVYLELKNEHFYQKINARFLKLNLFIVNIMDIRLQKSLNISRKKESILFLILNSSMIF